MQSFKINLQEFDEENFRKNIKKKGVWQYMARNHAKTKAKCMVDECGLIVKTPNSGTSGCHTHLKKAHNFDCSTVRQEEVADEPPPKITRYFEKVETYPAYLARLCSVANIPFHRLATDEFLEIIVAKGYGAEMIKSPHTIRQYILKFALETRQEMSKDIKDVMALNKSGISLTIDEWTSTAVKKYMAVNVHVEDKFWHLGLYRLRGSYPAKKMMPLLKDIMAEHELSMERDVVGITSDAASVMKLLGNIYFNLIL